MKKQKCLTHLPGLENEVYCWVEQESSIMLKASSKDCDPVALTSENARSLAKLLLEKANELEELDN